MRSLPAALSLIALAGPVAAHHPMGGEPMTTFAQGLLSGIGHPILGPDHLAFVIVAGIAAARAGLPRAAPAAFVAAMLAGCLAVAAWGPLPLVEPAIALSLVAVGGVLALGRRIAPGLALGLLAAFGLFHGGAFGLTLIEAEAAAGLPVLAGYLLGLGATQVAIAAGAARLASRVWPAGAEGPRLAGAMAAGIGVFLALTLATGAIA